MSALHLHVLTATIRSMLSFLYPADIPVNKTLSSNAGTVTDERLHMLVWHWSGVGLSQFVGDEKTTMHHISLGYS